MKREEWRKHVSTQASSGLSAAEYCREHTLNEGNFSYWKNHLARSFVQISGREPIEIELGNGARIIIPSTAEASVIAKVIEAIDAKH